MESYSVKAVLSATDNMSGVFQKAASSAGSFRQKMGSSLQAVGKTSTVLGLAVGAMTGKAIKSYGDFQESINKAAVIAGSSNKKLGSNMKDLEKVALSLGKTLPISAEDAGNAMVEMARNGASIKDLKKEFPSIAKAAAVSGADLSATATTVQQAMNIWGGGAKNAAKDSATLAIVANKSNAEIGDMQQVFANVGTTAKNMGYSLKDVAIAAGVMTNAGIPAAQASMDLNHAFTQMVKPSKTAQGEMKKLGLSYTNAQGEMKPLKTVIKDVANATKGMSGAQKTAALNMLFGSAGAKAMAPLLDSVGNKAKKSGKGWDSFSSAIDKGAGTAKKANKYLNENSQNMTKNVGQSLAQMADAFDALVKTSIGSIAPQIRAVADALGDFATWLNNSKSPLAGFVKKLIALSPVIAGVLVVFGLLSMGLGKLFKIFGTIVTVIRTVTTAFAAFNAVLLANPIILVVAAIAAVVAALVLFFTKTETGRAIWQSFTTWLIGAWNTIKTTAVTVWTAVTTFLTTAWTTISTTATTIWTAITTFFSTVWNGVSTTATAVWTTITTFLSTTWTNILTVATTIWNAIKTFFTTLWAGVSNTFTTVWASISTGLQSIWQGIVSIASGIWNMIKAVILGPVLLVIDLVTGSFTQLKSDIQLIWTSIQSATSSIWNGIKSVISGVAKVIKNLAIAAFNGLKSGVIGIWNGLKSAASSIWNGMKSTLSSAWNGMKSAASNAARGLANAAKSAWNGLKSSASSIWSGVKSVVSSGMNGARSAAISAANGMRSAVSSAWNGIKSSARSVVSGVRSIFRTIGSINLYSAGSAIMRSFYNGLISTWNSVKGFVSGIGSWIRKHKGPISYDRKLLIPAGNAIMNGFNKGLVSQFNAVKNSIQGMTNSIAGMASNALNDNIQALNSRAASGSISSNITGQLSVQQQPANISLDLGGSNYTAFVNDISHKQGQSASLKRTYRV